MMQNIMTSILVLCSFLFLVKMFFIKPKKSLQGILNSPKSSGCGCGSSCPLGKLKK